MKQLKNELYNKLHIVFGTVNDKDLDAIIPLMPIDATYYFCKPRIPRGMNVHQLTTTFLNNGFNGKSYTSVNEALNSALHNVKPNEIIFAGGSTFVVAEII